MWAAVDFSPATPRPAPRWHVDEVHRIVVRARELGLIVGQNGAAIEISPRLDVAVEELEEGVDTAGGGDRRRGGMSVGTKNQEFIYDPFAPEIFDDPYPDVQGPARRAPPLLQRRARLLDALALRGLPGGGAQLGEPLERQRGRARRDPDLLPGNLRPRQHRDHRPARPPPDPARGPAALHAAGGAGARPVDQDDRRPPARPPRGAAPRPTWPGRLRLAHPGRHRQPDARLPRGGPGLRSPTCSSSSRRASPKADQGDYFEIPPRSRAKPRSGWPG